MFPQVIFCMTLRAGRIDDDHDDDHDEDHDDHGEDDDDDNHLQVCFHK